MDLKRAMLLLFFRSSVTAAPPHEARSRLQMSTKALCNFLISGRPTFRSKSTCLFKTLKTSSIVLQMSPISSSNGGDAAKQIRRFPLSPSSLVVFQKGDITKWFVDGASDAIVNAANERMLGGGGVDGAIHRAAGPELRAACLDVPEVHPDVRCPTGEARITPAFRLPVSHVVHTVGPIYDTDVHPEASLRSSYRSCLRLAKENNIQYIAFPAISCGLYGYPFKDASRVAITTIKEFPKDFKEVHFVLFSDEIYNAWLEEAQEWL